MKYPARRRTRYQDDQEYDSLFKQYETHFLHAGIFELILRSVIEENAVP